MNTYSITYGDYSYSAIGATPSKAKYQCFKHYELGDFMDFGEFIKGIESCRLIHKFHPSDLFGNPEQFDHMKQGRGIDFAYMGMRVEIDGQSGVIVGANHSMNLDVCLEGEHWRSNCHPHWRVKYFDHDGHVLAEYGA